MKNFRISSLLSIMIILLSSFIVILQVHAEPPISRVDDLLCRYDLLEGEGQYTYDGSGMENDAVLGISTDSDHYDPDWVDGVHDAALKFDGVDDFVNCGNGTSLQVGRGSFTVEAWTYVSGNLTDNLGGILSKFDPTEDRGFYLDVLSDQRYGGIADSYGQVVFGMNQGHNNETWNVAVGRYDSSYSLQDLVVYDGGLFVSSSQGDLIEWTGGGWVKRADAYSGGMISSLAVYDGKIFGAVASTGELVRWEGSGWIRVAHSFNSELINCLAVYNGMLYAGTSGTGQLLEWNGVGAWAQASSQYSLETEITRLCVHNGQLYGTTSPTGYLLQWNGRDNWAQKAQYGSGLYTLAVYRGRLYTADSSLYEWNGINSWVSKSSTIPIGTFNTLSVFGGKFFGGTNGGILYEWNGNDAWIQRAPLSGSESIINAMCTFRGKLFAVTTGQGLLLEWNSGFSVTTDTGLYPGWNHIVAVKDAKEGSLGLYINGELSRTSYHFDPVRFDLNCTKNLMIGQGSQDTLKGIIDRVRIFGKPLSEQEILAEYDFFSMEWRRPLPPTSPDIRSGDLFVNLTWEPPISLGTHDLLGYRVYRGTSYDGISVYNETSAVMGWFNDTDVSYGETYYYLVTAFSEAGESLSEDIMDATPKGKPTPPINISVHSGDRFVNISWKPPLINKGSNITGYRIERGLDLNTYYDLIQLGPGKRYYNDTIVDNRQTYYYRIIARNDVGESLPSSNISAVPKKLPPPVISLGHTPSDMGADLQWNKCSDPYFHHFNIYRGTRDLISGGLMGRYYNEPDLDNLSFENQDHVIDFDWGTDAPIPRMEDNNFSVKWDGYLKAAITGSYTITIRADGGVRMWIDNILVIDKWKDEWHEELSTSVYLLTGDHQIRIEYFNHEDRAAIRLSWAPPDQEPLTIPTSSLFGYYITYEMIQMTPETHYKDEGLEIGRYYYYYVRAVNDAGESPMGNIIEVYPIGLPGEPRGFTVTPGDGYINLTWEQPSDLRGSKIVEYRIFRANGTENVKFYANVSGDQHYYNDSEVVNGLDYFYYITASNAAGESDPSVSLKGIPVGRPSPPRNPKAEMYEGYVKITWASPKFTGGADMVGFNVYRSINGGNRTFVYWVNDYLTQGYIDMDIAGGNTYNYWVTALNEVGESALSQNASIFIPAPVVVDDDDIDDDDIEPVKNNKDFPMVAVVLSIVVLLIIAIVIAFLVVRSKRRSNRELMIGPVSVDGAVPMQIGGIDDTFDIFHPAAKADPLSQVMEEVYHDELPHMQLPEQQPQYPTPGYPEDQYYPQDQYYQQQGVSQVQQPYYPEDQQQFYPDQNYPQDQYCQQEGVSQVQQPYYPEDQQQYYQGAPPPQYLPSESGDQIDQRPPLFEQEADQGAFNEFLAAPSPQQFGTGEVQEVVLDKRPQLPGQDEEQ